MKTKFQESLVVALFILAFAGPGFCDYISNIQLSPASPACLAFGQTVNITFNYSVSEAGGTLIFVRPFSSSSLTPNYSAHASPNYPAGTGTGTGDFSITSGDVIVDHLRFQLLNSDQNKVLLEFFIPVEYHFSSHVIDNINITPNSPASFVVGQNVDITFNYTTNHPGGVRIFARPITAGATTPEFSAHGSPLYPTGSGSGTGYFSVTSGNAIIDHIRFQMYNDDQSQLLLEFFLPVDFRYAAHAINNIVISPGSPDCMLFDEHINVTFDYRTSQPGGVRIFLLPFTDGTPTKHFAVSPSPLYPPGNGSGNGFITVTSDNIIIDRLRFKITNADQSQDLLEFFIPVYYPYSLHRISNIVLKPTAPAYLTSGHDVEIKFDYLANQPGGVRIFARPYTAASLTPNYGAHGSPLYSSGSGNGDGYFNISNLSVLVDHLRFQMYNESQSQLLLEFFLPALYYYGNQNVTGLAGRDLAEPQSFALSQNYPNPFNPSTTIDFNIPHDSFVSLKIFDTAGGEVTTLISKKLQAGNHHCLWNAAGLPNGIYFYRLQVENQIVATKKLTLLK